MGKICPYCGIRPIHNLKIAWEPRTCLDMLCKKKNALVMCNERNKRKYRERVLNGKKT